MCLRLTGNGQGAKPCMVSNNLKLINMAAIKKYDVKEAVIQWDRFFGLEVYTITTKAGDTYKNLAKLPNGNYTHPVLIKN